MPGGETAAPPRVYTTRAHAHILIFLRRQRVSDLQNARPVARSSRMNLLGKVDLESSSVPPAVQPSHHLALGAWSPSRGEPPAKRPPRAGSAWASGHLPPRTRGSIGTEAPIGAARDAELLEAIVT